MRTIATLIIMLALPAPVGAESPAPRHTFTLAAAAAGVDVHDVAAAWSRAHGIRYDVAPSCSGPDCIVVTVSPTGVMVGGWWAAGYARPQPDGSCVATIDPWVVEDAGPNGGLAVALHEVGHCSGLSHSPERGSIMSPALDLTQRNPRPTADDLRNLADLYQQ